MSKPTEDPSVLGVEMTELDPGPLAEQWVARFGAIEVCLGRYAQGRFNLALGAWEIGVGECEDRFIERADAVAAIERELLAIRATIPEPG